MPYLIGIHSTLMEKARQMDLGDAVILDADKNTVETEHNDLAALPSEIVSKPVETILFSRNLSSPRE